MTPNDVIINREKHSTYKRDQSHKSNKPIYQDVQVIFQEDKIAEEGYLNRCYLSPQQDNILSLGDTTITKNSTKESHIYSGKNLK